MSRPESYDDIEVNDVDFGTIELGVIGVDGTMLKAYGAFMEAMQKAGATVTMRYGTTASFSRAPREDEKAEQLRCKQAAWDEGKRQYELMRDVGECEYTWQESSGKRWAEQEGLSWPPEHKPIDAFDAVIRDIDMEIGS